MSNDPIVIIGAGPAGITCGYKLANTEDPAIIIEKDLFPGGMYQIYQPRSTCPELKFIDYDSFSKNSMKPFLMPRE